MSMPAVALIQGTTRELMATPSFCGTVRQSSFFRLNRRSHPVTSKYQNCYSNRLQHLRLPFLQFSTNALQKCRDQKDLKKAVAGYILDLHVPTRAAYLSSQLKLPRCVWLETAIVSAIDWQGKKDIEVSTP